jgi:hypothetical protein
MKLNLFALLANVACWIRFRTAFRKIIGCIC